MDQSPGSCLKGCLALPKVAYFRCGKSRTDFKQLSMKLRSASDDSWLPTVETILKQATLSCLGVAWKVAEHRKFGL
jgi:hypothetical protein